MSFIETERNMNDRTLIRDMAAIICRLHHFARDGAGRLFVYKDGVYAAGGEFFIRQQVKRILAQLERSDRWSSGLGRELIEYILLDAPELNPKPPEDVINVENGLLNIWSGELGPHTPRLLSTIRVPIRYEPAARCRRIDEFIAQVFPPDSVMLAWEALGDLLTPDRSIQKAIALVGEGGNGKGVFLQLAVNFVGPENVSHLSLQRLEADRFAPARLYGKLANICSDLPSERMAGSAVFEAITGCDRISGEFKYRDSFEFTPFARLLISANHLPASRDASKAFFDRWLIIPFHTGFRNTRQEIPRSVLDRALSTATDLSGALNAALPALRRIRRRGKFSDSPSATRQAEEHQYAADPLSQWLARETICSPSVLTAQDRLHAAYALACAMGDRPILTKQMFGRRLRALRPDIEEAQRTLNGRRQWVYLGVALQSDGPAPNGFGPRLSPAALERCSHERPLAAEAE
jgi:P4 family phage/plasmid primase-like protien